MAIDAVRQEFKSLGIDDKILEFDASSATVDLAAEALHVEPARIAKTLSFKYDDSCILVVSAGDTKIDNAKFKKTFGFKAKMLAPEDVERLTGHAIGGVCPFGLKSELPVYLDVSMKRFATIFPACGSSHSAIELTCDKLLEYSRAKDWVDVCKGWQQAGC